MAQIEAATTHEIGPDEHADSSWAAFHGVSMLQFLHYDRRPTLVLDLHKPVPTSGLSSSALFVNPALRQVESLLNVLDGHDLEDLAMGMVDYQGFLNWVQVLGRKASAMPFHFAGYCWSCTIVETRWGVVIADTFRSLCTCATSEPESELEPTSKPASKVVPEITSSTNKPETGLDAYASNRPSREGSRSTSTTKSLNPLVRARHFFAGEMIKEDSEKQVEAPVADSASKEKTDLETDTTESSTFGMWSDVRIAKRNAELLAKVSAFDTVGISITNETGNIVFANDAWYNICGLPHGPADAATWMSVFEVAELPKIMDVWKRITIDQEPGSFQTPLKWRWNSPTASESGMTDFPVWISVWAYPDISDHGETIGCCTVLIDISQQKWAEQMVERQLAEAVERAKVLEQLSNDLGLSDTRFRRISDSMPHGIFVCNVHGNMLYTNDAYAAIFPASRDPTSVEPWWSHIPEDELARATEVWRRLREDRVRVSFEMSFLVPSETMATNELRYMACSSYPELDEEGGIKHITGTITDITHLKLAEQTQGARADHAEESKRQLERFIDMTSHEIRNPLSAILHSAEEILSSLQGYPQAVTVATIQSTIETVATIIDCTNHSTRIVDDILVVSKLESGLLNIAPAPVQLTTAVKQCLKMFDGEMRAAEIRSSLTIDKSIDEYKIDWVCLDVNRVLQILINLITNAIKFTRLESLRKINTHLIASLDRPTSDPDKGEPRFLAAQTMPSIIFPDSVESENEVVYIKISVTDSGCGLTQDEQKNLFQRFSQAGKRTHVKYGGTGLGLFISRQLCEMQGGQIGLQSEPGQGSIFTFYVEARRYSRPKSATAGHDLVGLRFGAQKARALLPKTTLGMSPRGSPTSTPSQKIILLVEDNLVNQKVVAKMLRSKGFTIVVANHGQEALEHVRNSALLSGALMTALPISLILLDVEMPVMDGLTCIRRIRKMADTGELRCHVPAIAVTANARQEQIDQARDAGMDDVVTKPFRFDELHSVMTRLWSQYPV